jgi:hypothetical protein
MATRINKNDYIRTPFGGFKRSSVKSVTPTDTGVVVIDDSNQMIFWHEEADAKKAQRISCALMDAVISGEQVDWDSFEKKPQLEYKQSANTEQRSKDNTELETELDNTNE